MTDHEQTALAALVAWRTASLDLDEIGLSEGWEGAQERMHEVWLDLITTADLVIAERAAAVGR